MKLALTFLFTLILAFSYAMDSTYNVVEVNGKKGLKDAQGNFVIPAEYDDIGFSNEENAPVDGVIGYKSKGLWGLINLDNKKITSAKYSSLYAASNHRLIASIKGKVSQTPFYGLIDTKGKAVISFKYYALQPVSNGLIALARLNHQYVYGLVNYGDQQLLGFEYEGIKQLNYQLIKVQSINNHTWVVFNTATQNIAYSDLKTVTLINKSYFLIQKENLFGVINEQGQEVIPILYEEIRYEGNLWRVKSPTKWKVLDEHNQGKNDLLAVQVDFIGQWLKVRTPQGFNLYNQRLEELIPVQLEELKGVSGHKLLYKERGQYRLYEIDKQASMKSMRFDTAFISDEFVYGAKRINNKLKWALYDTFGVKRTHFDYELIKPYQNRLFSVKRRDHWGFITREGKEVIHCVYDEILDFNHGLIVVKYHNQYGVIDKSNNWVVLPQSGRIKLVSDKLYLRKNGSTTELRSMSDELIYFSDNPLTVEDDLLIEELTNGEQRLVSLDGVFISQSMTRPSQYQDMKYLRDEMVAVKMRGKYGFINKHGNLRITNRYEDVGRYNEQGIPVQLLGKWGMIDTDENIAIQPLYDTISSFNNGVAIAIRSGKYGLVNAKGKELLSTTHDSIKQLSSGDYLIYNDEKYGLADEKGNQVINTKYQDILPTTNGNYIVKKREKYGTVNHAGVNIIPAVYDELLYHPEWQLYFGKQEGQWQNLAID